jgi:hypothetical protein
MTFLHRHHDGAAYFLAMASAGTPVFGLRLDDVKWVISVVTSMVGAAVALYIFVRNQIEAARLKREIAEEEERRRQKLLDWEQRLVMREVELGRTAQNGSVAGDSKVANL